MVEYLGHVMHPASHWRLTMDIKKRLSLKRGMAKAELDEVRDNIKRNKTIVDEMAANMGVSIETKSG